jgi:hypothetical protein
MTVQDIFVTRVHRVVQEMASILGPKKLTQIVSEPTDYNTLLRAMEESLPQLNAADPLAEDRIEGLKALQHLLEDSGPMFSAVEMGQALGISRQAVHHRLSQGELLAVRRGRAHLYPSWQVEGGQVLPGLPDVLRALQGESPWSILRFFVSSTPFLQNQTPLARLQSGDVDAVLRAAIAHGSQGAS